MHYAIQYAGYEAILEPLTAGGFNVNTKDFNGHTALHVAAAKGKTGWAEALIKTGADVNAMSKYSETPLDLAIRKGQTELADFLRKHGDISGNK